MMENDNNTKIRRSKDWGRLAGRILALAFLTSIGSAPSMVQQNLITEERDNNSPKDPSAQSSPPKQFTPKKKFTLEGHSAPIHTLVFSPDGKTLASAGDDGRIILWDAGAGRKTATLGDKSAQIHSIAFSPDGKTLASGTLRGEATLWDVGAGKSLANILSGLSFVNSVVFSPDGRTLAKAPIWQSPGGGGERRVVT